MDKILIRDLKIFAYHGVNPEEKEEGQNFVFDIDMGIDMLNACNSDDLNDTVSYAKVIKSVTAAVTAEKYDLLEKLAQVIADNILENFYQIQNVRVTVKKPEAPMKADFSWVGVEIYRER